MHVTIRRSQALQCATCQDMDQESSHCSWRIRSFSCRCCRMREGVVIDHLKVLKVESVTRLGDIARVCQSEEAMRKWLLDMRFSIGTSSDGGRRSPPKRQGISGLHPPSLDAPCRGLRRKYILHYFIRGIIQNDVRVTQICDITIIACS